MRRRGSRACPERRAALRHAAAAALLLCAGRAPAGPAPPRGHAGEDGHDHAAASATVRPLVAEGEALLAEGDAAAALQRFEAAAAQVHAPEIEQSIVRAQMQLGQYRRALAFAAHTAGAHRAATGGTALYAWLLELGGQHAFARRLLEQAQRDFPQDALLAAAAALIAERGDAPPPVPTGALLEPPWRLAPHSPSRRPAPSLAGDTGMAVLATATLAEQGRAAWAPAALLTTARSTLAVRNGRGETRNAKVAGEPTAAGLVRLELDLPLPWPAALQFAPRAPFAGSPVTLLAHAPDPAGRPAWPRLATRFAGRDGDGGVALAFGAGAGLAGGPLFDRAGRVAGIAVGAPGGDPAVPARLAPVDAADDSTKGAPAQAPAPALAADSIYELGMPLALQLLGAG